MKIPWRGLFIGVILLHILFLSIVVYLIFKPNEDNTEINPKMISDSDKFSTLLIHTSKEELNKMIESFIREQESEYQLRLRLENDVKLYGKLEVFNRLIDLNVTFTPQLQRNGDLVLKQKSMKIGELPLPVEVVLKYVEESYPFPEWMKIDPKKGEVYLELADFETKKGYRFKIKTFDLIRNKITVQVNVPIS